MLLEAGFTAAALAAMVRPDVLDAPPAFHLRFANGVLLPVDNFYCSIDRDRLDVSTHSQPDQYILGVRRVSMVFECSRLALQALDLDFQTMMFGADVFVEEQKTGMRGRVIIRDMQLYTAVGSDKVRFLAAGEGELTFGNEVETAQAQVETPTGPTPIRGMRLIDE